MDLPQQWKIVLALAPLLLLPVGCRVLRPVQQIVRAVLPEIVSVEREDHRPAEPVLLDVVRFAL